MANIEITSNPKFIASNLAVSPEDCATLNNSGAALAMLTSHENAHKNTKTYESDLDR